MATKWNASFQVAPIVPRDDETVPVYPNLLHSIKWGTDIGKAVLKDYTLKIKTRVGKLEKYADISSNLPTHLEYPLPEFSAKGVDEQLIAEQFAQSYYGSNISSVSFQRSNSFSWRKYMVYFWRSRNTVGYNLNSNYNTSKWNGVNGLPGNYLLVNTTGHHDFYQVTIGVFEFEVNVETANTVTTYTTTTDNSTTPPTVTTTPTTTTYYYEMFYHVGHDVVNPGGSANSYLVPNEFYPSTGVGKSDYNDQFGTLGPPNTYFNSATNWEWDHIRIQVNLNNGEVTYIWVDMVKWAELTEVAPIINASLPFKTYPIIPIRLNLENITNPNIASTVIGASLKYACRQLQMSPKAVLDAILSPSMSLSDAVSQATTECDIAKSFDDSIVCNFAELEARKLQILDDDKTKPADNINDIFIMFLTSFATKNKYEKELLFHTVDYMFNLGSLPRLHGTYELVCSIPDMVWRVHYSDIIKEVGFSGTVPSSLDDDGYAIVEEFDQAYTHIEVQYDYISPTNDLAYRSDDNIHLFHKDLDTNVIIKLTIKRISTGLETPKSVEHWDGSLPQVTDDLRWASNIVGSATGTQKDVLVNNLCIPIIKEVYEPRTVLTPNPTNDSVIATKNKHIKDFERSCLEYGASLVTVQLERVYVPWYKAVIADIIWFVSAGLQIFAIVNFFNPIGWTLSSILNYVSDRVVDYLITEVIGFVVGALVKILPPELATVFAIVLLILKSKYTGGFDSLNNVEYALELVNATSNGLDMIFSVDSKLLALEDRALQNKIDELQGELTESKKILDDLLPAYLTKTRSGAYWDNYNDDVDPNRFINEQVFYGDSGLLIETPTEFYQRTVQTPNPGLVGIHAYKVFVSSSLDPNADIDLGLE